MNNIYKKLEELKFSIDIHNEYFSDGSIMYINSSIQEIINYIDKKYNNTHPENKIKNYIKGNLTHINCECSFLIKDEKELMEISFIKSGCYYYVEYYIKKENSHIGFIKIMDKFIDGLYDDWHASTPKINYYNIILTLEELVKDLNKY